MGDGVTQLLLSWLKQLNQTINLHQGVVISLATNQAISNYSAKFPPALAGVLPDRHRRRVEDAAKVGVDLATSDYRLLNANLLLGAWGGFEAFIDDVCVEVLASQPTLLQGKQFEKVQVPVAWLGSSDREVFSKALTEAYTQLRASGESVEKKFQARLKLVGLDVCVHTELSSTLRNLYMLRNVWAHRAGVADSRFIGAGGPWKGLQAGDDVPLSSDDFDKYTAAMTIYSTVVTNVYLESLGQPRLTTWSSSSQHQFLATRKALYGE